MAQHDDSFLDEGFLRRLEQLKFLARQSPRSAFKGDYSTSRSGASVEFLDYRKYQIGDDLRYVDWNVYSRLDKLFIKLFRAEKNQTVHLLLDMSRSMDFGEPAKHLVARKIAAAIGYISLTSMNYVGVTAFADALDATNRQAGGRQAYLPLVDYLLSLRVLEKTDINGCLAEYAATSKQRGIAVILSDLMDPGGFEHGIRAMRFARFDISLIQVLDHQELFPALNGHLVLRDMETGQVRRIIMDQALLEAYRKKIAGFIDTNREICLQNGVDYHVYDTRQSFEDFLITYVTEGTMFR
ncbi:MAG: DUF58 domain-containing protein [Desulfobacteraceae bacterium]|nr:DUF58 domain-containing protein [Desulfobacteraceae bacterium]